MGVPLPTMINTHDNGQICIRDEKRVLTHGLY